MGWFGPSKDEVWRQLSQEIGAEFVAGGFWKGNKVQAHVGPWTITLDTYTVTPGEPMSPTPGCVPLTSTPRASGSRSTGRGSSASWASFWGCRTSRWATPSSTRRSSSRGTTSRRYVSLFANAKIRQMIQDQPKIRLEVKDSEGWFGPKFPEDVDELHFQVVGVIKDIERLKSLFDLFAAVLDQLCRIGSAYKQEPGVVL